jgi:hypothetical protein
MVPMEGIEPPTLALRKLCSTSELHRLRPAYTKAEPLYQRWVQVLRFTQPRYRRKESRPRGAALWHDVHVRVVPSWGGLRQWFDLLWVRRSAGRSFRRSDTPF